MPKAFSSILKRDRSVEKAQVRISYKLNERLKYYKVTFRCIHGGKNFKKILYYRFLIYTVPLAISDI